MGVYSDVRTWLAPDLHKYETVKVDADAVFLPQRLREKLGTQQVTDNGIYIENCKFVNWGFFGNLEVFSQKAAATYMAGLDDRTALHGQAWCRQGPCLRHHHRWSLQGGPARGPE